MKKVVVVLVIVLAVFIVWQWDNVSDYFAVWRSQVPEEGLTVGTGERVLTDAEVQSIFFTCDGPNDGWGYHPRTGVRHGIFETVEGGRRVYKPAVFVHKGGQIAARVLNVAPTDDTKAMGYAVALCDRHGPDDQADAMINGVPIIPR